MYLTTRIYTLIFGRHVGTDLYGNKYYETKRAAHGSRTDARKKHKRWVIYKGKAEPSKVPADWHGWLHYTHETPLGKSHYAWEKPHIPNLTGTTGAYMPPGHLLKGADRDASTTDYQAWQPRQ